MSGFSPIAAKDIGTDQPRQVRVLVLSDTFLPMLMGAGLHAYAVDENPLPPDARIVAAEYDGFRGYCLKLLIESAEFEPVPPGSHPAEIVPMFSQRYDLSEFCLSEN